MHGKITYYMVMGMVTRISSISSYTIHYLLACLCLGITYQERYAKLHNWNSSCAKAEAIFVYQCKVDPFPRSSKWFYTRFQEDSEVGKSLLSFCFYHPHLICLLLFFISRKPSLVPVWTNQSKRVLIPLWDSTCASKVLPLSTKSFGIRRALHEAKICLLTRMHMRNYPRLALWGNSLWSLVDVDVAPGAIVIVAYRHTSFE